MSWVIKLSVKTFDGIWTSESFYGSSFATKGEAQKRLREIKKMSEWRTAKGLVRFRIDEVPG